MLSVSKRAIYRRMERYGLGALNFSNIADDEWWSRELTLKCKLMF